MDLAPVGPPPDVDPRFRWRLSAGLSIIDWLGIGSPPNLWESMVHGEGAYVLYMQDRLPEAARAIERAMLGHAFVEWLSGLMYLTAGEMEARDFGERVERDPFLFEVPAADLQGGTLADLVEGCAADVEGLLKAERQPCLFTFLPPGSLAEMTDSPHGYMTPKLPYYKVCLPLEPDEPPASLAQALVHEYTHVLEAEVSQGRAPRWLSEGLAEWAEDALVDNPDGEELILLEGEYPRLGEIEGLFHSGRSVDEDEMGYAYAGARGAVDHLVARHGMPDVVDFLHRLREEDEGRAFKAAFGESERAFEKAWHQWLRENPAEAEPGS